MNEEDKTRRILRIVDVGLFLIGAVSLTFLSAFVLGYLQ